jgi:putative two-component system response regulator
MFKNRSDKNILEISESLNKLAYLCEIHEWDNRQHLDRMIKYALIIAKSIGLSNEEASIISIASQLHDVGKIRTPKELLITTKELNPGDWKKIEEHTLQGAAILESKNSVIMQTGAAIALTHHERWNGSGYPRQLKSQDIPLSGRICALIDVFDALTTHRSYKEIISDEEALRLIKESSGILFDPDVVKAFDKEFLEIRRIKKAFD